MNHTVSQWFIWFTIYLNVFEAGAEIRIQQTYQKKAHEVNRFNHEGG